MVKKLFFIISVVILNSGCSFFYVVKQGAYQLSLLADAEPISLALRRNDLDRESRRKLELILDVRAFAAEHLFLRGDKNYKDVNLSWRHVIHTVSASDPLKFKPYLWWFPVIGNVPYKGYFEENDATKEEQRLKSLGLETQKRKVHGYSTLGYFADPVWPAMLGMNDFSLIDLIIHELAHATVYFANQTPFNETFASFVGQYGARAYIANRFGKESEQMTKYVTYEEQSKRYDDFFQHLYDELEDIYSSSKPDAEIISAKEATYHKAKSDYETMVKRKEIFDMDWSLVNNAYLLSFKSYNHDDKVFADLLTSMHGDFRKFIDEVAYYGRSSTPFLSLRTRISALGGRQ